MIEIDDPEEYLTEQGLTDIIPDPSVSKAELSVYDSVRMDLDEPLPPEWDDLARLHKSIRKRKCFTVLEFGLGYSTVVIADAIEKNRQDWEQLEHRPEVRNTRSFEVISVDASTEWIDHWQEEIPAELQDVITLNYSPVEAGTFNGQLCHYYTDLPDVVPDFVYLDAPHPKQVEGSVNGLSFSCEERTVMSADLLLMEPTLLPGTYIVIDGRTNNARFLERNLQRPFEIREDSSSDVTTIELTESRLGGEQRTDTGEFTPGKSWKVE